MLSSSNGISPFPQISPFLNWNPSTPSSFCLNDNHQALLYHHQYHEDLLSYCFTVAPININETATTATANKLTTTTAVSTKKTTSTTAAAATTKPHISSSSTSTSWARKQTKKRDRHSKIFTAQGPRDRRVRLSIDISRKFFGLQDLLGFDKASLTLDWLLTKSKAAIRELLQTKQQNIGNSNAMCLCSLSEELLSADDNNNVDSKKTAASCCSKRKRNATAKQQKAAKAKKPQKMMTEMEKLAKESRAKARERARERTREKTCLRNLCQEQKLPDLISFSPSNNQLCRTWSQIGSCKSSTDSSNRQSNLMSSSSNHHENNIQVEGFFFVNPRSNTGGGTIGATSSTTTTTEEMFQESLRIKRKITKPPACSSFAFQRNLIVNASEELANSDFNNWPSIIHML